MEPIKFSSFNCSEAILKAVSDMGFEEATPIQAQSIPFILEGKDVIGQAQTGTGKTASFGIPLLEKIDPRNKQPQALVLCPTRELAIQVAEEIGRLGKYIRGIKSVPIYGGQPIDRQIRVLRSGAQIVIGTPGRVIDHLKRGTLKLHEIKFLVLDEADEMLNMGFVEDITEILKTVPPERQTVLFSATMPKAILDITNRYQRNPELVKVVHKELTSTNVEQFYLEVHSRDRVEVLSRLLDMYQPKLSLAFCNTKKKVDEVTAQLQTRGFSCDKIHGDMKQQQRDAVMDRFRTGAIELLIATDVAARGLDISGVECVFNVDVPQDEEYYVHRIGRTGRAGKDGMSFTFVSGKEFLLMKDVMRYTAKKIQRHEIPSIADIEEIKAKELVDKIKLEAESGGLEKYFAILEAMSEEGMTSLEAAAILMKMELERYKVESSNVCEISSGGFGDTGAGNGMVRLFINVGKNISLEPRDVIKWITSETTVTGEQVGNIDIYENFSFVEVPEARANEVFEILKNAKLKGKRVRIDKARGRSGGGDNRFDRKPRSGGSGEKTYKGRDARHSGSSDKSYGSLDRPKRKYKPAE